MIETREAAAQREREELEQERRDWYDALQNPATVRVFLRLLTDMGVGRLMVTENDMRMRNVADQILDSIASANPDVYVRMMRALKNI